VITTNLGLVEIEQRYTPRVSDRIMEGGTVVAFTGESMREGN
jgi:DNA replication protein DnaC